MVIISEVKKGSQCAFELARDGKPCNCGEVAIVTAGRRPLCREHAEFVISNQRGLEYKTPVGNNHYVPISKAQFLQEAGLD